MSGRAKTAFVLAALAVFGLGVGVGRLAARPAASPAAADEKKSDEKKPQGDEKKPDADEDSGKPKVRIDRVEHSFVSPRLVCFGTARSQPGREVVVGARAAAIVSEVRCRTGDPVAAGAVLLRLDARPFAAARARAEGALAEANAELRKGTRGALEVERKGLEVALAQSRLDALQADRTLARQEELAKGGLVSERQLQEAQAAAELAKLRLAAATQQLERASGGIQAEELARLEARVAQARADLDAARLLEDACELRAPEAGVVSELDVVPGQAVDATAPLARIASPGGVDALLLVPAERAGEVKVGADVRLLAAGSEVARAKVAGVAGTADGSGLVRVRATVDAPELARGIVPGTPLAAEVALGRVEGTTVASKAVIQDGDRTVVFLVDAKNVAHKLAVKVLVRDGPVVAIEGPASLVPGAQVIVEGGYNLPDGAEVDADD